MIRVSDIPNIPSTRSHCEGDRVARGNPTKERRTYL